MKYQVVFGRQVLRTFEGRAANVRAANAANVLQAAGIAAVVVAVW